MHVPTPGPVRSRILVYDPSGRAEIALRGSFRDQFFVDFTRDLDVARSRLVTRSPDVVLSALPPGKPFSLLEETNLHREKVVVIAMAPSNDAGRIAEAFDRGAQAYLPLPLDQRLASRVIEREIARANQRSELVKLRSQIKWDDISIPGSRLEDIERIAILRSLDAMGGSTGAAARMLGISVRKIQYRLREWRMSAPHLFAANQGSEEANSRG